MTYGDRIRQARELLGWTQDELARKIDVSQPVIAQLEAGLYSGHELTSAIAFKTGFPPAFFSRRFDLGIRPETRVFLRDCYDHTVQLMALVESYRDVLSGLMEIYLSSVSFRTNEIMRVLTVISSVFIPLTFITGVYGMNFVPAFNGRRLPLNMPELYHPLGYIGCLLFMLGVAIFQIVYFKKRGWL